MSQTAIGGQPIAVGDYVSVICQITAITPGSSDGIALLTLTPKYAKPDGTAGTSITSVYANQVFQAQ